MIPNICFKGVIINVLLRDYLRYILTIRLAMKERGRRGFPTCSKRTHFSLRPKNGQVLIAPCEENLQRQWSQGLVNRVRLRSLSMPTVRATDLWTSWIFVTTLKFCQQLSVWLCVPCPTCSQRMWYEF